MSTRKVIEPKEWPWYDYKRYSFCMAAQKGNWLFLSGNTASEFDPDTKKMVFKQGLMEQTAVNYDKIKVVVESAGGTMADIVKVTDYIVPREAENYSELERVRANYFNQGAYPAGTSLVVDRLLRGKSLLETECVAVLGDSSMNIINPGWADHSEADYSPAVQKEDLLFISGQVGIDHNTGSLTSTKMLDQAEQAYLNVEALLHAAGASFKDVVSTTHYIAPEGCSQYSDGENVRARFFKDTYSAHNAVVVHQNVPKEALIKVDCVAVLGNTEKKMYDFGIDNYKRLTYRPVVQKGKLVCLSGVTGTELATGNPVDGDTLVQMRRALENAQKMLAEAGMGWDDVMMVVDFVVPEALQLYPQTADIRREIFKSALPPSTGVVQNGIVGGEGLVLSLHITAAKD
jgi:2-iminobutanoate/2-iminopropanoate deaminase